MENTVRQPMIRYPMLQRWLWIVVLIVGTVSIVISTGWQSPVAMGLVQLAACFASALAIMLGLWLYQPLVARAWHWWIAGFLLLAAGNIYHFVYAMVTGHISPFPGGPEIFFVSSSIVYLIGAVSYLLQTGRKPDHIILLDIVIIVISLGGGLWSVLISPLLNQPAQPPIATLTTIFYPLIDVLILAIVVQVFIGHTHRTLGHYLVLAGFVVNLLTDLIYSINFLRDGFNVNGIPLIGWVINGLLLAVAALHPSMGSRQLVAYDIHATRLVRNLILGTAAAVGPATLIVQTVRGIPINSLAIAVTWLLLVAVAIIRINQLMQRVQRSEAYFRALVQESSEVLVVIDANGRISYVSPAADHLLGPALGNMSGKVAIPSIATLVHPDDAHSALAHFRRLEDSAGEPRTFSCRLRDETGKWRALEIIGTNLVADRHVGGIVIHARDVTVRKAIEEQLAYQAYHDGLTGLPNRELFHERLTAALERSQEEKTVLAVLYLDVDFFKMVNDSLGHAAGDQLLIAVGQRLQEQLHPGDTLARLGGDEFTVLIENISGAAEAQERASQIIRAFRRPFVMMDQQLTVGTSIGIVLGHGGVDTLADLLRYADVALYEAKGKGKGRFAVFDPTMSSVVQERAVLLSELQTGIENREFVLHYQPLVDLGTGQIVGLEALVRWQHPTRGLLPPGVFIPFAEDSGLILALGDLVLAEACRQAHTWYNRYGRGVPLVSVNLSAKRLQRSESANIVLQIIAETGVDPQLIELELTESALLGDADLAAMILDEWRASGLALALDDFGTGYASLTHLQRFPITTVKIDQSFVRALGYEREAAVIVQSVLDLADRLHLRVVAEGVETPEQAALLRKFGCTMAQGYYYAKPLPVDQIELLLANPQSLPLSLPVDLHTTTATVSGVIS